MDYLDRESSVNRIVSGLYIIETDGLLMTIDRPSCFIKYHADIIYKKAIDEVKYDGFITKPQARQILLSRKILPEDIDNKKKGIEKDIDNIKCNLYKEFIRPNFKQVTFLRKSLAGRKKQLEQIYRLESLLDNYTMESYAVTQKTQYIISSCLNFLDQEVPKDIQLIERAMEEVSNIRLGVPEYKELARTEPWKSMWIGCKENPFGYPPTEWTEEQKLLVFFSKMYDNAYEHPECPEDSIIEDDDLFDGWLISEKRKEKENSPTSGRVNPKHANADEMFHVVRTPEDLEAINAKNSTGARMIKKQRQALLNQKGTAKEKDFTDRKLQMMNQLTELRKGK